MRPERILVVDDEERIIENIVRCLAREGFQVTGAHNGDEAVHLFQKQRFDLVLLDISMPGMNGYEVMEHIFGLDDEVLVIIMTGFASIESAVRALKLGAWDYLKKPFEYADLVKTVKNGITQKTLLLEKKTYAARLEASEKQYQYMVNNSPDLIFTLDENRCFSFVNQQFEHVLGFPKTTLMGKPFKAFLHKDDQEQVEELSSLPEQGRAGSIEMNLRLKKANARADQLDPYSAYAFMELKASSITLPGGDPGRRPKGIYAVARDVTERIHLEAQLLQAQKMEAIGTLAGGIAHDFNNILMGIQGYTSLVKTEFDSNSDVFKRLSCIDEYVYNGADMARQLLGFSQKSQQAICRLNLNYLLKMSAKMFGRTKKNIIIDQDLEKKLWNVKADEGQLKQVLMNLFVNAWQAMPHGGKITISTENVVIDTDRIHEMGLGRPGAYVKVSVADTGLGMDKTTIARIFDPFFTTKERGKGTGLGLATAYGIIKSHNGAFQVDSRLGQGSSFMFYLPASEMRSRKTVVQRPKIREGKLIIGKGRVLLVDDEKSVIDVCSEMLETLGYDVVVAGGGIEAIRIVKDDPSIDLIILDMVMPEMNGFKTYEEIRKINPALRVLVCSGYSKEEEIRQMIANGCNDYIYKPFDVAMLSEKLQTVFNPS